MDQTSAAVRSRDQAERIQIGENLDAAAVEKACQNGNTHKQPRRQQFHVRMIVHMKPCRAMHGGLPGVFASVLLFGAPEQPDRSPHCVPITHEFRRHTRSFGYAAALITCHSDIPFLAQFQTNREGTLFGPRLILLRHSLRIVNGN
jgi:hypothetical protein